jgi:hypothetical protein
LALGSLDGMREKANWIFNLKNLWPIVCLHIMGPKGQDYITYLRRDHWIKNSTQIFFHKQMITGVPIVPLLFAQFLSSFYHTNKLVIRKIIAWKYIYFIIYHILWADSILHTKISIGRFIV